MRVATEAFLEANPILKRLCRGMRYQCRHHQADQQLGTQRVEESHDIRVVHAPLMSHASTLDVRWAQASRVALEPMNLVKVVVRAIQREPECRYAPVPMGVVTCLSRSSTPHSCSRGLCRRRVAGGRHQLAPEQRRRQRKRSSFGGVGGATAVCGHASASTESQGGCQDIWRTIHSS